jgi:hypothetical protein
MNSRVNTVFPRLSTETITISSIFPISKSPNILADIQQQALIYLAGKNVNNAIITSGPVADNKPTVSRKDQALATSLGVGYSHTLLQLSQSV